VKATLIVLGVLASTNAVAAPPHVNDGVLVDEHDMTLYVFGGTGTPDAKSCESDCEKNFPPALAQSKDKATDSLSLVPANNGERQWAFHGKPLYRGAMDKKPGDTHGDGLTRSGMQFA
jgi:predicted lipoprotein with Yx(FWY)xxD motif